MILLWQKRNQKAVHTCSDPRFIRYFVEPMAQALNENGYESEIWTYADAINPLLGNEKFVTKHDIDCDLSLAPWTFIYRGAKLVVEILRARPHVLHCHKGRAATLPILAGWVTGTPVRIYHNHGFSYLGQTGWRKWILRFIEKVNLAFSTHSVTVSHSNKCAAEADMLVKVDQLRVLANGSAVGIDEENFKRANSHKVNYNKAIIVGFAARPHFRKGFFEVIKAWEESALHIKGHKLYVAGCSQAYALNLLKREVPGVEFMGYITNMDEFYKSINILLLPSHHEGFGQVIIEAAAYGIPTIASNIPGITCAIQNDVNGVLIPVKDVHALSEQMQRLVRNVLIQQKLGQAAKENVEKHFRREQIMIDLVRLYEKVGILRSH